MEEQEKPRNTPTTREEPKDDDPIKEERELEAEKHARKRTTEEEIERLKEDLGFSADQAAPLQRIPVSSFGVSYENAGGVNSAEVTQVVRNLKENFDTKLLRLQKDLLEKVVNGKQLVSGEVEKIREIFGGEIDNLRAQLAQVDGKELMQKLEDSVKEVEGSIDARMARMEEKILGFDATVFMDEVREAFSNQIHQLKRENKKLKKKLEKKDEKLKKLEAKLEGLEVALKTKAAVQVAPSVPEPPKDDIRPPYAHERVPPELPSQRGEVAVPAPPPDVKKPDEPKQVKFCTQCGRPRKNLNANFCTFCGARF